MTFCYQQALKFLNIFLKLYDYIDVKYLIVPKKLYLLKTFTIDNDRKFE